MLLISCSVRSCRACKSGSAAYLVMQNGDLEYGQRRCGFNTKHQSTKGKDHTFRPRHVSFPLVSLLARATEQLIKSIVPPSEEQSLRVIRPAEWYAVSTPPALSLECEASLYSEARGVATRTEQLIKSIVPPSEEQSLRVIRPAEWFASHQYLL